MCELLDAYGVFKKVTVHCLMDNSINVSSKMQLNRNCKQHKIFCKRHTSIKTLMIFSLDRHDVSKIAV